MAKRKQSPVQPLAKTKEGIENQMINLAIKQAKAQLEAGTASSQVVTHYLKLATERERLQVDILELEKELVVAKTESYRSAKNLEGLMAEAISAMRTYSGSSHDD